MNIGFVNNWCNRGQGVVAKWVRTIFDEAGHNTYVLARPTNPKAPIGSYIDERDDGRLRMSPSDRHLKCP